MIPVRLLLARRVYPRRGELPQYELPLVGVLETPLWKGAHRQLLRHEAAPVEHGGDGRVIHEAYGERGDPWRGAPFGLSFHRTVHDAREYALEGALPDVTDAPRYGHEPGAPSLPAQRLRRLTFFRALGATPVQKPRSKRVRDGVRRDIDADDLRRAGFSRFA